MSKSSFGERYQIALVVLGIIATLLLGAFFYRELFPEYRIYQKDYIALEEFRSTYTHEPPPAFNEGIKQIVIEASDKGPPAIDRCISCHVALQFEHFSPTKIGRDLNGEIMRDANGFPEQVVNENYVWKHVDEAIQDADKSGNTTEAARLRALKVAHVGDKIYDVTKVLRMHPLMGRETRPFEFHPIEEYGCVICHNGNGRGLTTEKAHGPVFDGQYEIEFMGPKPEFIQLDPENDPAFAKVFNHKPGHELLFQTSPLYVGGLIEAKCVQCHQSTQSALQGVADSAKILISQRIKRSQAILQAYEGEKQALSSLMNLQQVIKKEGLLATFEQLQKRSVDYTLPLQQMEYALAQAAFLQKLAATGKIDAENAAGLQKKVLQGLHEKVVQALGSEDLAQALESQWPEARVDSDKTLQAFFAQHKLDVDATGTFFRKALQAQYDQALMAHVKESDQLFAQSVGDEQTIQAMTSDVDLLTQHFGAGQQLFLTQACYACHRIAGYSRGGVGPELTQEGDSYPWFVKESIVWPQADLKTSTMPNYQLDHEEVEDLVTYLLAQKGQTPAVSEAVYKISLAEWEAGRKLPWEKPVTPAQMYNVRFGMTVFATQGCAACHRLEGFESNVGFAVEKEKTDFKTLYQEKEWFQKLFPENILATDLVETLEKQASEIDRRIVDDVRQQSILEEIEAAHPGTIEAYYTIFKYAARAKNAFFAEQLAQEKDSTKRQVLQKEEKVWKERVHRVLMVFIQEYGLGRLVGPRPNWSGVYRSDEWLMEHFRAPTSHVPRSIMPVFPFDDTKFYALTHMLDILGIRNRQAVRQIWSERGFKPAQAYQLFCSQCHGDERFGNGPLAEWLYPIPKNLRNAQFLRNLTKEQAVQSILHGVKGTPMPPWGETPQDKPGYDGIPVITEGEARQLVDWLYSALPGEQIFQTEQETPKWHYTPDDVMKELRHEGHQLEGPQKDPLALLRNPTHYLAALSPTVVPQKEDPVSSVFQELPNPISGPEKKLYYIKKEYYTPENIKAGEEFFQLNCAVCHGKDADGLGNRAGVMQDAKPRILVNLDWLHTRDDLRLLRSIKYGVPGTSMTPWGDQTTGLQRLQLVIYIRSLSQENLSREKLSTTLYQTFDTMDQTILKEREENYSALESHQQAYSAALKEQRLLAGKVEKGEIPSGQALKAYQEQLAAGALMNRWKEADELLLAVRDLIKKEREIDQGMGLALMQNGQFSTEFTLLLEWIASQENRYRIENRRLEVQISPETLQMNKSRQQTIMQGIETELLKATHKSGQESLNKLKIKLLSGFDEAARLRDQQIKLVQDYNQKIQELQK